MSSDSEHIPKPSKRVRCRISDSESSDDSSPIRLNRRHRSAKFNSDDSNSDEGSDIQLPGRPRRRRTVVDEIADTSSESGCSSRIIDNASTDSEWQSDWDSVEDSDEEFETVRKRKTPKRKPEPLKSTHSESEDSDGTAEKCPICLLAFRNQEVGTPSACDHCFCLICLTEWSKNVNTCPVDRQEFRSITVRSRLGGEITRHIPIEVREHKSENELENDATYCQICEQCDREERMLLCDGCDLGFHMECLNPPMDQVPIEEWFCQTCSNNQDLAESVEIDLDEVPDLMAEARLLGVTYGRTRSGLAREQDLFGRFQPIHRQRLVPRTRQTERVRANIRAGRSRDLETESIPRIFDPDQPSTSSGFESISENSRGRSPYNLPVSRTRRNTATTAKRSRRGSRKKKSKATTTDSYTFQEVRIRELDAHGIERETVTYVKVKQKTSRKYKKRSIKKRKKRKRKPGCRGRNCQVAARTVKSRLAQTLGLVKRRNGTGAAATTVAVSIPNRIELTNLRYRAGIPQLNMFGEDRILDYVPLGSDDDLDDVGADVGSVIGVQRRNTLIHTTNRRRLALKGISVAHEAPAAAGDLLSSIISSQELWHSRESKNNITLKADGTLLLPNKETNDTKKSVLDNKPKVPSGSDSATEPDSKTAPDTTTINSADIIQAPMYSSSRAGGMGNNNPGDGGSFRGNYHDRGNHGHGGQDYGLRDSYSGGGRLNYGGPGPRGPPGGFGHDIRPPMDFNPNFDNRRRPPPVGMPHFRHRPHMNFRDNRRGRFPMDRGPFRGPVNMSPGPVFPHPNHFQGSTNINNSSMLPNPRVNAPPHRASPEIQLPEVTPTPQPTSEATAASPAVVDSVTPEEPAVELSSERADADDCDIYCDIEAPSKPTDSAENHLDHREAGTEDTGSDETLSSLLPPPHPPDLLDFDDKSDKDESDGEDLVIDDTPKDNEESAKIEDKYDPFSVGDSDSNDSSHERRKKKSDDEKDAEKDVIVIASVKESNSTPTPLPLAPPPTPPDFSLLSSNTHEGHIDTLGSLARLGAYDEDDDEDSQDDCPNFSIYSSETMDVARHTEQELSQQIGPLEPPPMPPEIPDDDDCIVADVQACDLSDIPEPVDPYVASLQKERQTLSKLPPKKISIDSRGKITFKIGNKLKLNNRLNSLYDELDDNVEVTVEKDKSEVKEPTSSTDKRSKPAEKIATSDSTGDKAISENSGKKLDDKLESENTKAAAEVEIKPSCNEYSEEVTDVTTPTAEKLSLTPEPELAKLEEATKNCEPVEEQQEEELDLSHTPRSTSKSDFELQKDNANLAGAIDTKPIDEWESDGAYTPCKDEMPVKDKPEQMSSFESGLEPITPPAKDRSSDDLGRCPTPIEYAGLGTEAISETDEAINFEDEPTVVSQRKEKEMEDGEITDDKLNKKQSDKSDTDDASRKKKKDRRKQVAEKNKENISSDNQVAWKKISKSTKDRQYREKGKNLESREKDKDSDDKSPRDKGKYREKSKEKIKKKVKDTCDKKKEKRKELPRYDVRKIVAEKPARQRKDEYGRDIRDLSRTMSRSRSPIRTNKRSHSREFRLSRSYSPRMNSRSSRSWSRRLARSWSRNRQSPAHKRSVSRSRRKSPVRERRSLSRRRSRSPLNRRSRRSLSNQRQRRNRRSVSRKYRSRSRSWSRSQSRSKVRSRTRSRSRNARAKDKSKKHKSRSRSKRRKRSRSKTPPRKATSKTQSKKRSKRSKLTLPNNNSHTVPPRSRSRDRSYSRDRSRRNWSKVTDKAADRSSFGGRAEPVEANASWSAQWTPSWSRSRSRTPPLANRSHNDHLMSSHDWSPSPSSLAALAAPSGSAFPPSSPPSQSSGLAPASGIMGASEPIDGVASPKNLTVILRNKDAIKNKKRKEKKAKERKKSRETERRKVSNKRNRTPPPSKEVFASGDNILVSVCFNNENASGQAGNAPPHLTDPLPLLTVTKRRHREPVAAESAAKKPKKDKSKDKRSKSPTKTNRRDKKRKSKAAEIAATKKPVAVIDLDQSPFREQTPSPRDVIVLSDDDQDDDHNNNHNNMNNSSEGNGGNAGASHTGGNNNDANINKNISLNDDDEDEEPANLRVQEPQRRLSASLQHMQQQQQQLQLQLQAEQSGKAQEEEQEISHQDQLQQLHLQQRCSVVSEHDFIAQGPKTPPEPQVKFSIKQSGNLRPTMLHPLFDGDDDEEIEGDSNAGNNAGDDDKCANERSAVSEANKLMTKDNSGEGAEDDDEGLDEDDDVDNDDMIDDEEEEEADGRNEQDKKSLDEEAMTEDDHLKMRHIDDLESGKIGPNTPPEPPSSPMTSPDAYDPFDPTKSRSPTPDVEEPLSNDQKLESTEASTKESANDKSESDKPKVISMVTIKHAPSPGKDATLSATDSLKMDNSAKDISVVSSVNSYVTSNPVLATVAAAVQRSFNAQRNISQANHISPSNQLKQRTTERTPQLGMFMGPVKNLPMGRGTKANRNSSVLGQNGNDLPLESNNDTMTVDTSSPYSPGSSLSDGMFDPPSPARNHHSPSSRPSGPSNAVANIMKNTANTSKTTRNDKKDLFDSLFGSSPSKSGANAKLRAKKISEKRKKASNSKIGVRMDENQLQILDDLPSSAVEMQVKDKFLKKLNRQERVVEEVKLVLKPHYTKKHVTKDEYKDIMRKAVPKICHNRTGEINPKKIAQLVEAYVKRCRSNKRKVAPGGLGNPVVKLPRPQKNPWS